MDDQSTFYPHDDEQGQARSHEGSEKMFSHQNQEVSISSPTSPQLCPLRFYVTLTGVDYAVTITQPFIGINYFLNSFPTWPLVMPSKHTVASVASVYQEPGISFLSVLKQGSVLAPWTSFCPAALSSDSPPLMVTLVCVCVGGGHPPIQFI